MVKIDIDTFSATEDGLAPDAQTYAFAHLELARCYSTLVRFNPQQVLGVAATTDAHQRKSITDERTWQDFCLSLQRLLVLH